MGHPGFTLTPIGISDADMPRDVEPAMVVPGLLMLSAVAHPEVRAVESGAARGLTRPGRARQAFGLRARPGARGAFGARAAARC